MVYRKDNYLITTGTSELIEVILYVQDMNRQVAFYRDILGFGVKEPVGVKDFRDFYAVRLQTGSCSLKLHTGKKERTSTDSPQLVFRVKNIHGTRYDLLEQDVEMGEIHSPEPGVMVSNGKDPEGNAFSIEARSNPSDIPVTHATIPTTLATLPSSISATSLRGRSIVLLRHNKFLIATEIIFVIALVELLSFVNLVPLISLLLVVMALIWLRGGNWSELGLQGVTTIRRTVIIGLSFGILFSILQMFAIAPIVSHFFHTAPVPGQPGTPSLRNDVLGYIYGLIISWSSAGFAEEMIFRGYLLNRLADLFGHRFWGWTIALFVQAAVFGSAHAYENLDGMIVVGIYGVMIGLLYFGSRRNLWVCAITHALTDTITFTLQFLGI